jgi:hypothetical protein
MKFIHVDINKLFDEPLISLRETARKLGRNRRLIGYMVAMHEIPTRPIPSSGRARGLDRQALDRLVQLLEIYDQRVATDRT